MIFNAEQMYKKRNTAKDSNWSINSILSYKMELFLFLFIFLIAKFTFDFPSSKINWTFKKIF